MERLTFEGNFCDIAWCTSTPGGSFCEDGACSQREIWERLKAYEDTGLSPKGLEKAAEIENGLNSDGYSFARMVELMNADKDGRVVVLPCKVGDTVYRVITIKGENPVVLETQVKTVGQAADVAQLIGKKNKVINIFLTREEAEKALEAKRDG